MPGGMPPAAARKERVAIGRAFAQLSTRVDASSGLADWARRRPAAPRGRTGPRGCLRPWDRAGRCPHMREFTTSDVVSPDVALAYKEAAGLAGVSADTIKRDRENGDYPNAFQEESRSRTWRIPVSDLVAAGRLAPDRVVPPDQRAHPVASKPLGALEDLDDLALRERVVRLEERLVAATALATERGATVAMLRDLLAAGRR